MSFFQELKRRNVFRVAVAYLAFSWLLIEVADTLFPTFGIPSWAFRLTILLLAFGFLPTLVFSWAYEITPEGLRRETDVQRSESITHITAKRLDFLTMGLVVVAIGVIAADRLYFNQASPQVNHPVDPIVGDSNADAHSETGMPDSIAVLPFANRSALPEDSFFVDGMHDDLLTYISQISDIKTISRTSVMKYRDSSLSIPEIATELGVTAILEGGVQRAGDQVRVNVQLIDARTDAHLWSQIYDRQLTAANLFAIQSEIATAIAASLRVQLTPGSKHRVDSVPTKNLDALENYFLGRQSMVTRRVADLAAARSYFEGAIHLDPEFALALVGFADATRLHRAYSQVIGDEALLEAKQAIEKALLIDPLLGEAYATLGTLLIHKDWDRAESAYRKAIELSPNYAPAHQWFGEGLVHNTDRVEEALVYLKRAVELDPNSAIILNDYAEGLEVAGQAAEAMEYYHRAISIEPQFASGYRRIAWLHVHESGRIDEAVKAMRTSVAIEPGHASSARILAQMHFNLSDLSGTTFWLTKFLEQSPQSAVPEWYVIGHPAISDDEADLEQARALLERADGYTDQAAPGGNPVMRETPFEMSYRPGSKREQATRLVTRAYRLQQERQADEAIHMLEESLELLSGLPRMGKLGIQILDAKAYALLGQREQAVSALDKAATSGWRWNWTYELDFSPELESLREDPVFQRIRQSIAEDISEQLNQVRRWQAQGMLSEIP